MKTVSVKFVNLSDFEEYLTVEEYEELVQVTNDSDYCFGTNSYSIVNKDGFLYEMESCDFYDKLVKIVEENKVKFINLEG